MYLASLHLRDFRNFVEQRLEFPAAGVAIVGDNGQGKTNLLEAIYYLQIFRSFRGAADDQLVRFGTDVFRVEGLVRGGTAPDPAATRVAAAFDRRGRRKKVTVDGVEPERVGDAVGRVGAVVFSPADVAIVSGGPGERRRFLDIHLSVTVPGYLHALQRYRQVLSQRNALLRVGVDGAQVAAWDHGLAGWGGRVSAMRAHWVAEHNDAFARHVAAISDGTEAAIEYEASAGGGSDAAEANRAFVGQLERTREREARRGTTLVGPHRDDLRIRVRRDESWIDLRTYGSGGQQRTAAVALRMVEAESIRAASGRDPIILLDDVFAELDPGRSRRILRWIEDDAAGQVILTAPKPTDFGIRGGGLARWTIRDGRVQ